MEAFISGLIGLVWTLAGAAVIALCGYAAKKLKGWRSEHSELLEVKEDFKQEHEDFKALKEMQEVQNAALREILGDMLDKEHDRLVVQGYASTVEKERFEKKYKPYHGLGGNGSRTSHFDDVMTMHTLPSKGGAAWQLNMPNEV